MKATRKCSFCGKSFVTRSGMQRYCSEACQAEAKRARVMQKNNLFKVAQPLMEIQHQEYLTFSKAAILMGCSRLAKTEHSHPLGMVVSTHFRCGKGVKRGLKNGALPFNID